MVYEQEHHIKSCPPGKETQCSGGQGVQGNEGQNGLATMPRDVRNNQRTPGPTPNRLICIQTLKPATTVCELATRSRSNSLRCIQPELITVEGICESPMEHDRQSPSSSEVTESPVGTHNPPVESTTVVSSTPEHGNTDTNPPTEQEEPISTNALVQQTRDLPTSSRVDYLRERHRGQRISGEASKLLLASWRQKSSKSYDSMFTKWASWCSERDSDPISGDVSEVVNFLAHLFEEGYQYRSLNAYRSAISSVHDKVDGSNVGQHPLIARVLKGAFNEHPPQPRYLHTWDVNKVTSYIDNLGDNANLSLQDLTMKLTMLLALTRPTRSSDITSLDLRFRRYTPEGVVFKPTKLAKQSKPERELAEFFFTSFPHNTRLCPVSTLHAYEAATSGIWKDNTEEKLLIATIKPHKAVASFTIARWLKTIMDKAGIDTIFKAHSVRSASVSTAANAGVTTTNILKAADWSSQSIFQKFYYKPQQDPSFGRAVLSKLPTTAK